MGSPDPDERYNEGFNPVRQPAEGGRQETGSSVGAVRRGRGHCQRLPRRPSHRRSQGGHPGPSFCSYCRLTSLLVPAGSGTLSSTSSGRRLDYRPAGLSCLRIVPGGHHLIKVPKVGTVLGETLVGAGIAQHREDGCDGSAHELFGVGHGRCHASRRSWFEPSKLEQMAYLFNTGV